MRRITLLFLFVICCSKALLAQNDTLSVIHSWVLSDDYLAKIPVAVDTNLEHFQIYNPIYNYSYGNAFLGNIGSPVISEIFFSRKKKHEFYFSDYYYPYIATVENSPYYNLTMKPTAMDFEKGDVVAPPDDVCPIPGKD